MARLVIKNYSVLETNSVAAVRTGEIKAQYPMSAELAEVGAQNGQLLAVDDVTKEVSFPATAEDVVYLHASEERLYESHVGRDAFILNAPNYPKMLKLTVGDIFETDAIELGTFTDKTIGTAKFGGPTIGSGDITLLDAAPESAVVLSVVEAVTLPNGKPGIKFAVTKA